MADKIYRQNQLVRFRRRANGPILNGRIAGRWAKGEGDGYCIASADEYYDVRAKLVVGPQPKSVKPYWKR